MKVLSIEDVVKLFVKEIEQMEGEEIVLLANEQFGIDLTYIGDSLFETADEEEDKNE
jgi:hypothetical protein